MPLVDGAVGRRAVRAPEWLIGGARSGARPSCSSRPTSRARVADRARELERLFRHARTKRTASPAKPAPPKRPQAAEATGSRLNPAPRGIASGALGPALRALRPRAASSEASRPHRVTTRRRGSRRAPPRSTARCRARGLFPASHRRRRRGRTSRRSRRGSRGRSLCLGRSLRSAPGRCGRPLRRRTAAPDGGYLIVFSSRFASTWLAGRRRREREATRVKGARRPRPLLGAATAVATASSTSTATSTSENV